MNFQQPRTVIVPDRLKGPDRPGNYQLRYESNGAHGPVGVVSGPVGVATIEHIACGQSAVSARILGGDQTMRYLVDYERQDEAWDTCIRALAEVLRLPAERLVAVTEHDVSYRNAFGFGVAMSDHMQNAVDCASPEGPRDTFEARHQAQRASQGMPPGGPKIL